MKLLHTADWHLGSPLQGFSPEQRAQLQAAACALPRSIASLCRRQGCELLLLSGDIFDGPADSETVRNVRDALEEVRVPVFIAPGNHDFVTPRSPWLTEQWPENVHIFTEPVMTSVSLPELSCRVWGAGYTAMDCPGLLEDFHAHGPEDFQIGVLHADPLTAGSPYCPVTRAQIGTSGLTYLALGHIHKTGQLTQDGTVCCWPGCPMGRGWDETGPKGVLLAEITDRVRTRWIPLDGPVFSDLTAEVSGDPVQALSAVLPAAGSRDFFRVTLTGECSGPDLQQLYDCFADFPNLTVIDRTREPVDLWACTEEDTLEGALFRLLRQDANDPNTRDAALLAARITRQLLDGQEVELP